MLSANEKMVIAMSLLTSNDIKSCAKATRVTLSLQLLQPWHSVGTTSNAINLLEVLADDVFPFAVRSAARPSPV